MEPQVLCQQLDKAMGKVSLQHAGPSCWSALEGRTYDYFVMSGSVGQLTEGAPTCLEDSGLATHVPVQISVQKAAVHKSEVQPLVSLVLKC